MGSRGSGWADVERRVRVAAVPTILAAAAAALFLWRLGASSYFIDETLSLSDATGDFAHVFHAVHLNETTPPTYFALLHIWLQICGSHSEAVARLPSAAAAVGLVVAVWYLANLLTDAPTAFFAGLLTLLSPIVLEYAQQARVYAFLMLAATLTTVAAVKAVRRSSRNWLAAATVAAVTTVSLQYTGWLLVGPLAVWLASRSSISPRMRLMFCSATVLAGVAWLPEFLGQLAQQPNGGLGAFGALTQEHALAVLSAPLYGRAAAPYAGLIGVALLLVTATLLAAPRARLALRERGLLAAIAATPLAAVLIAGLAGKDLVTPRYATIAVPFVLIAFATATRLLHPLLARVAASVVMFALMLGLALSMTPGSAYPDARGVVRFVAQHWKAGDFVYADQLGIGAYLPISYYAATSLPDQRSSLPIDLFSPAFVAEGVTRPVASAGLSAAVARARMRRNRLWIVAEYSGHPPSPASLMPPRYQAMSTTDFIASVGLRLVLAVPTD